MKRINNLYPQICSIENLQLADSIARKGKAKQQGVIKHLQNQDANIKLLHEQLINKTYRTCDYKTFTITDPKVRVIYSLPYYPHRIVHHAVMNVLEPVFMSTFTADTYSCIKGKGVHAAANALIYALKDVPGTTYCLKLDIRKFYPSIDHTILKRLIRRKFKDQDLLEMLDGIIDSADGLPIGNYLSQYLANFYLAYFDHWIKEYKRVKYYFRYADDLVIVAGSKEYLHDLFREIQHYLATELNLKVKGNYQVFPVDARSIDFLGYCFYHTHVLLRKFIKVNFARAVASGISQASWAAYQGWLRHCDGRNLVKKLTNERLHRLSNSGRRAAIRGKPHQNAKNPGQKNNRPGIQDWPKLSKARHAQFNIADPV